MAETLIVSLDEFAELVGVTPETMRTHLRTVGKDGLVPAWLIERGDRGRPYKIEAEGAVRWWQDRREADEQVGAARLSQLAQLRFAVVGDAAEGQETLSLSGRQRKEEFAASMEAIKYRKMLGQLLERDEVVRVLSTVAVEHRRALAKLPAEFGILAGLDAPQVKQLEGLIERAVDAFVTSIEKPDAFAA